MPDEDPIPFYPDLRCWAAPLRPGQAPKDGCDCRLCRWARGRARSEALLGSSTGPIRPGTPEWKALLEAAQ